MDAGWAGAPWAPLAARPAAPARSISRSGIRLDAARSTMRRRTLSVCTLSGAAALAATTAHAVPIGGPLRGHQDRVWAVVFSPDGRTLVSVDMDGQLRYWDVATRRPIGAPIQAHNAALDATFGPNGTILATAGIDAQSVGNIRFWDFEPVSWKTRVCAIVGRNLTQSEWARYLPDVPYEKTCEQWLEGE